jgi:lysozyme
MKSLLISVIFSPMFFEMSSFEFGKQNQQEAIFIKPDRSIEWVEMVEIVKESEGFYEKPYQCPGGKLTIGYGHTKSAKDFDHISKDRAHQLLIADLKKAEAHVERIVKVPLDDGQKACLISFTFNCGQGNLKQLVEGPNRLNSGNYHSVNKILPLYRMADGKVLRGLEIRRAKELALWSSSDAMLASK